MACGADTEANALIVSLTAGKNFDLPDVNLDDPMLAIPSDTNEGIFAPVARLTNDDLTTQVVGGTGTFDALMGGYNAHLKREFEAGRITGAEYTKAYIALTEAAMANATSYLLGRDQAYWQAVTAQIQARLARVQEVTARVALYSAKVQLVGLQYEALNQEATYALTKMRLSSESMNYCIQKFNLEQMLPEQLNLAQKQVERAIQEIATGKYQLDNLLPQQFETGKYQLDYMLPQQLMMLKEQVEAQRAQTMDTRTDGTPILGLLGKQKDLYGQQIVSYKRDSEMKVAKLFTDAWITMKTIDEGLLPPTAFENESLNAILTDLKTNNDIG